MKFYITNKRTFRVTETNDTNKPLLIEVISFQKKRINPVEYENAGALIAGEGGLENFKAKCVSEAEYQAYEKSVIDYLNSDEYRKAKADRKAASKAKHEAFVAEMIAKRTADYERILREAENGVLKSTFENICIVLKYFNIAEAEMPKMSIGYSLNRYDCDGKLATAMILSEPIEVEGKMIDRFVCGAPRGYLKKYYRAY